MPKLQRMPIALVLSSLLAAPGLMGCGTYTPATAKTLTSALPRTSTGSGDGSSDGSTTDGTSTDPSVRRTGVAPYSFLIQGAGYDSHTLTVSANRILKVKFTPGKQNRVQTGTGYTWNYSALGVYINVGDESRPTALLNSGWTPPGFAPKSAESSVVMDYSGNFNRTCPDSNPGCRQTVTITVTKPNNDDACLNSSYAYCPYAHVPDQHPWNGTLTVETDDTDSL